jgi:hypothetical protein
MGRKEEEAGDMTTIPPRPGPEAALALLRALADRAARDECAGILSAWERSGTTADHDELVLERATRDLDRTAGAGDRAAARVQAVVDGAAHGRSDPEWP